MASTFRLLPAFNDIQKTVPWASAFIGGGMEVNEAASLRDIKNYYLWVKHEKHHEEALFYFQLLYVKPYHFNLLNKPFQQQMLSLALRVVQPTLLVAGNLFRHDRCFHEFQHPETSDEVRIQLYQEALEFMIEHTNASGIFLKDVEPALAKGIQQDESYLIMQNDISMQLAIPPDWTTVADYESALKHKYAQRFRKVRLAFNQVQVQAFTEQDILKYKSQMHNLYMQVCNRQLVCMGVLNEDFFVELKRSLKEEYRVCGFFYENQLIAFSSAIVHGGAYDMNYIGFDYEKNTSLQLYFNILFHCVEMAIQTRSSLLVLGRTAIEAKAIIGCEADYRFSFYKLRNVVVNWFFKRVSSYFQEQQGEAWKDRHPFKKTVTQPKITS
jgi:hypothetical protein